MCCSYSARGTASQGFDMQLCYSARSGGHKLANLLTMDGNSSRLHPDKEKFWDYDPVLL